MPETAGETPQQTPSPNAPPREARETREKILRAAHECLTRDGYERITTRRIAEAAGVNIATLHYYFGSKEALLAEATRFGYRQAENALRAVVDAAPDAASALAAALHEAWNIVRDRPGVLRYDLAVRAFRDAEAHREISGIYAAYRRLTEEILHRHLDVGGTLAEDLTVEQLARYIVAVVDGVVLQYALTGDEESARLGLALILNNGLRLMGLTAATPKWAQALAENAGEMGGKDAGGDTDDNADRV